MDMWVWMRMRHTERTANNHMKMWKLAAIYAAGAILLAFGIVALGSH